MLLPQSLYFPYTDITEQRLMRALLFFKGIILYRLPEDQIDGVLEECVEKGLADVRQVSFIADENEAKKIMAALDRWAEQFKDTGHLLGLAAHERAGRMDETPSKLAGKVRSYGLGGSDEPDPYRDAQVFLHFARRLEQQAHEIDGLMAGINQDEKGLLSALKDDAAFDFEENKPVSHDPDFQAPSGALDPGLEFLSERISAWALFYEKYSRANEPLFSDRVEVLDFMDRTLAVSADNEKMISDREKEVLEPFIKLSINLPDKVYSLPEILELRQKMADEFGPDMVNQLKALTSQTWTKKNFEELTDNFSALNPETVTLVSEPSNQMIKLTLSGYLAPAANMRMALGVPADSGKQEPAEDEFFGPVFEISTSRPA